MDPQAITASAIQDVFAGLATLVVVLTAAFVAWNQRKRFDKLDKIDKALEVLNNMAPGEQLDAMTTARLRAKPHDERTAPEQAHLDSLPPEDPPQGPSPTTAELTQAIHKSVNGKPPDQPSLYDIAQTIETTIGHQHGEVMTRLDQLEDRIGGNPPESSDPSH